MDARLITCSLLLPLLAGCATGVDSPATPPTSPAMSAAPTAAPQEREGGVPGYPFGEFPPVPLFEMPDLSMLDSAMAGFSIKVRDKFPHIPGITVKPAHCDQGGQVETDDGTLRFYGDGRGDYTGPDGTVHNYGNGSGDFTLNGKTVHVYGNGRGDYTDGTITIQAYGKGKGDYTDGTATIQVYGGGKGDYTDGTITIHNYGNGSGDYTDGTITIHNYGDGTGDLTDAQGETQQLTVNPLVGVPDLGQFPAMGSLKPITSCGTRIIIEDSVMFDFNKDNLRPEAAPTITKLATVLNELKVSKAIISGHTDAIGSDDYNQDLSERRANAVVTALKAQSVTATLDARGYGETQPIAPNEIDGHDNPAGRQKNRRVEIFIPAGS
ncbi:MAG: OmpA family protein [Propionibacteriales bacterium]|nr:OmpA family protein [Propionibacteriales bacterium]